MNQIQKSVKTTIRGILTESGFDEIGFARAKPKDNLAEHYLKWIESGYHSGMGWMERNIEKRLDILNIMPNAKSVIVTLLNYKTDFNPQNHGDEGKISSYAWGDDYHDVCDRMISSSLESMKSKFPGEEFRHYTDTGSVLEKLWAWRAGLGWQGRHSLLISRRLGSWCFISVIITSLEIEADTQSNDFCGSCTSCITACPTNAIVADKVVDSGKCISYWTIESKGIQEFPANISGNLNGWLFGCDICQEVCPWNSKTKSTQIAEFLPRNNQTSLTRDYINSLDNETFKLRFRNSPIKRRKLGGLQLNMKEIK